MNKRLIELIELSKSFDDGKSELKVLNKINWQLEANQSVCIQGSSGSGKTTFLHLISGLDGPTSGQVLFENQDINQLSDAKKSEIRNQSIGFVYQFHHLIQEMNIFENIILPIEVARKPKQEDLDWANYLLESLGIYDKKNQFPSEISGGQKQRVAIARSMINRPKCIIADEPTGNLDQKNADNIAQLLIDLQQQQKGSLVIATHDSNLASLCEQIYVIQNQSLSQIKG